MLFQLLSSAFSDHPAFIYGNPTSFSDGRICFEGDLLAHATVEVPFYHVG
uniref:Uncharacterized protein n=1 Tax=Octopus bimaculoides TaxID=37653 RepID=A0A0L8GAD0_OCTBM